MCLYQTFFTLQGFHYHYKTLVTRDQVVNIWSCGDISHTHHYTGILLFTAINRKIVHPICNSWGLCVQDSYGCSPTQHCKLSQSIMRYFIWDFCNPITWSLKVHFIDENAVSHTENNKLRWKKGQEDNIDRDFAVIVKDFVALSSTKKLNVRCGQLHGPSYDYRFACVHATKAHTFKGHSLWRMIVVYLISSRE